LALSLSLSRFDPFARSFGVSETPVGRRRDPSPSILSFLPFAGEFSSRNLRKERTRRLSSFFLSGVFVDM
ncbi:unnamed protein product, partial [Musa acuminata var. zebrina]